MARRQEWEQATARSRQLAIAADAELRRRYPDRKIEPLRPAEPGPVSDAERQHPDLIPHQRNAQPARIRDLVLSTDVACSGINEHHRPAPSEDVAWSGPGEASPALRTRWPDAILKPPKPQITPSGEILQHAAEHDIEPEPEADHGLPPFI